MDSLTIISFSIIFLIFALSFYFLKKVSNKPAEKAESDEEEVRNVRRVNNVRGPVRARRAVARGGNRRVIERGDDDDDSDGSQNRNYEEEEEEDDALLEDRGKMGAKKTKKLEMKAEKKALREAMEVEREELKKRQEERELERKKKEMKKEMEEKEAAEKEAMLKAEKKKKEDEEYQLMKGAFTVDEEGTDKLDEQESANLLQEFIQYIKDEKVVVLEELAFKFKLKAQDAIERIQTLCSEGMLTGVMDDRGKFIHVTNQEYQDVAKFIKQRGRVSISELSDSMNTIINLQGTSTPTIQASA